MESGTPKRVLIVANRTAATPPLIAAVRERAEQAPCSFTLLVPALPDVVDPDDEAKKTLELAMPFAGGGGEGSCSWPGGSLGRTARRRTLSSQGALRRGLDLDAAWACVGVAQA
jgi:hypothetical protein